MESQYLSGDLLLVSKVDSHISPIISNSGGGMGLLINSINSKVINTKKTVKMYKILVGGKISYITKDRILKILSRC